MKNLWKTLYDKRRNAARRTLAATAAALLTIGAASAETRAPQPRIAELDDLDFIEMLNSVDLGKQSEFIQKFQLKEGRERLLKGKYKSDGCTVENYRNKEVLLITVPASLLFEPNDTELSADAAEFLRPLRRYLKDPDMYRVLLVMHTDNTGSDIYRDNLTQERVDAVFNYFDELGIDTRYLFSYAMGDDMPLRPNDSMDNRAANRRLEIYLMPGKKMLEQAKKGRIAF